MFLILMFIYLLYDAWEQGVYVYCGLFVIARIVHTVAYLNPRQPLRNRAYLVGLVCTLATCGHIVHAVLAGR